MEYLLSLVWMYIEMAYFLVLGYAFFHPRFSRRVCAILYAFSGIALCLLLYLVNNQLARQITSCLLYVVLSYSLFKGNLLRHVLVVVISFVFAGIFDTIFLYCSCTILQISPSVLLWRKLEYTATFTIEKLLLLLFAWFVFRIRMRGSIQKISAKWLLLTAIFPVVSLIMLFTVYFNYQNMSDISMGAFIFSFGLAVANIAILYMIHKMELETQREQEIQLLNQQMTIQTESIVSLERSYRAQRQATHEFQHHLQTISDLASGNQDDALHEYLQELLHNQSRRILCVNSGHPIVDAVINQKYQLAQELDIDMQIQVNDLSGIQIKLEELTVLLSNLLENALEACRKLPHDRVVQIHLLAGDALFLSVRNTTEPVHIVDDMIPTTKTQKEAHGYGLPNIKRILQGLQGEFTMQYADGWFDFAAEIPL